MDDFEKCRSFSSSLTDLDCQLQSKVQTWLLNEAVYTCHQVVSIQHSRIFLSLGLISLLELSLSGPLVHRETDRPDLRVNFHTSCINIRIFTCVICLAKSMMILCKYCGNSSVSIQQ